MQYTARRGVVHHPGRWTEGDVGVERTAPLDAVRKRQIVIKLSGLIVDYSDERELVNTASLVAKPTEAAIDNSTQFTGNDCSSWGVIFVRPR